MWSAFERSLRGAPSPRATSASTTRNPNDKNATVGEPAAPEARKKKSVSWGDKEENVNDCMVSEGNAGAEDGGGGGSVGFGGGGGAKRIINRGGNNGAGPAAGAGGNGIANGREERSLNHLRVPSTRHVGARASTNHNRDGSGCSGSVSAAGRSSSTDLYSAPTASSARKRLGEHPGIHGIQAGALRVRTPAKPRKQRSALTPAASNSYSDTSAATTGIANDGPHDTARGTVASSKSSPTHTSLRRGGTGVRSPPRGSLRAPKETSEARPPHAADVAADGVAGSPADRTAPTARCSLSKTSSRPPPLTGTRRQSSAGIALRNVAGGYADDADILYGQEDEDGNTCLLPGADRCSTATVPSPCSSARRSSPRARFAAPGSASPASSKGLPPRSPRASPPNLRVSAGASPRVPTGERHGAFPMPSSPSPSSTASASCVPGSFRSSDRMLDDMGGDEEDEDEDDLLPTVTSQSLESRLAAASAAHRSSLETLGKASPRCSSPFSTSTTVRRRSTSLIHVNGNEPGSILSEEVSEESITVEGAKCPCQHQEGCPLTETGDVKRAKADVATEGAGAGAVEVRNRLEELQAKVAALEQDKVNLNMALVPMEERLASKEKAWESERHDLMAKASEGLRSLKAAEERCHELERKKSQMEEERHALDAELRRLRGEMEQKESKTAASFWQRTVAADREKTRLENELDTAQAKAATLAKEKAELDAELLPIKSEVASLKFRFNEAEKVASRVLTAEEAVRFSKAQLEVMRTEFVATSAQLNAMQTELAQQKARSRVLLEERDRKTNLQIASFREEITRLQTTILDQADQVVNHSISQSTPPARPMLTADCEDAGRENALVPAKATSGVSAGGVSSEAARIRQQELSTLRSELEQERERCGGLQKMVEELEDTRRRMHNTIQELRGSVRVFVRARPFLESDGEDASTQGEATVRCGADQCSVAVCPPDNPSRAMSCAFDHVFGGHASQEDVFKEVSGFVQSALDGFKVCLFSYGQTGSGKTHTMTGSGSGRMRGVIPRSVEHILARVAELQEGQWSYDVQASFLEIYNEELKDLLGEYGGDADGGAAVKKQQSVKAQQGAMSRGSSSANSGNKLVIRKAADGGTEVAGLTRFPIDTDDQERGLGELEEIMSVAQRARSVASTAMNAQSSRSHSVFTLWLSGTDASTGTTLKGVLHLVDLAGSERLDRSGVGADAQRLRETQSINKSLSCLADVFSSLSAKSTHIPFRNSKLTYLMQDCLSGDGKALMFVNLSPTAASANETVCSLRFANQVSQVELGKASRQLSLGKPISSSRGRPPPSINVPSSPGVYRNSTSALSPACARDSNGAPISITAAAPSPGSRTRASRKGVRPSRSSASSTTATMSPRTSCGSTGGGSFWGGRPSYSTRSSVDATRRSTSPTRPSTVGASRPTASHRPRTSSSSTTAPPPSPTGPLTGSTRTGSRRGPRTGPARSASTSSAGTGATKASSGGGAARSRSGSSQRTSAEDDTGARFSRATSGRSMSLRGTASTRGAGVAAGGGRRNNVTGSVRPSSAISRGDGVRASSPRRTSLEKKPRLSAS